MMDARRVAKKAYLEARRFKFDGDDLLFIVAGAVQKYLESQGMERQKAHQSAEEIAREFIQEAKRDLPGLLRRIARGE